MGNDKNQFGKNYLKFLLYSGGGWLLDFTLYLVQIKALGIMEGTANFISATIAASIVFITSGSYVFQRQKIEIKTILFYLMYIECTIIFWSVLIQILTLQFLSLGGVFDATSSAMLAKFLVTPFSLTLNFLVSRYLSEG